MAALSDPIADFLTRLRNATNARRDELSLPHSRIKEDVARVLKKEGFIEDFQVESFDGKRKLKVTTRTTGQTPAITGLERVSRPGLRRYVGADEIPRVRGGNGIAILSTSRGVMSSRQARREKVGGELLAFVY